MLETDTRAAAWTYSFGALTFAAAALEVIIALKFNLLRHPTIPLGVADLTWARLLLPFAFAGFAFFAWRNSKETVQQNHGRYLSGRLCPVGLGRHHRFQVQSGNRRRG